jgi:predicted transcriptional regulator
VVIFDDSSLREAADQMAREGVGRLPVVSRLEPQRIIGILSRSDLIEAHLRRLEESELEPGKWSRKTAVT